MSLEAREVSRRADALLEECGRSQLGLSATLERLLPDACAWLGAACAELRARDERRVPRRFSWGRPPSGGRSLSGELEISGRRIGTMRLWFDRRPGPAEREAFSALREELDGPLWAIQTAGFKQAVIGRIGRVLTRRVFADALDGALAALREAIPFRGALVAYRDDEESEGRRHYRLYRGVRAVADSGRRPHPRLDALARARPDSLLSGGIEAARAAGLGHALVRPLIAGVAQPRTLGALILDCPESVDAMGRDLLEVFANAVSQRLVDYNRERRHLSQFFGSGTIDELLADFHYRKRLAPRVETVAILYADINGFTRVCERALRRPGRIGAFVDLWSGGVVKEVWKHGGVFDKMVGDCVIAHFGPPFFREPPRERALRALKAAFAIQRFTRGLQRRPGFGALAREAGLPGLGVAIGVNLCPTAIGLFGPNQDFSAFSRGMNETARLQSHGGFREVLAMESLVKALGGRSNGFRLSGPLEAAVKNVGRPLRYYKVAA